MQHTIIFLTVLLLAPLAALHAADRMASLSNPTASDVERIVTRHTAIRTKPASLTPCRQLPDGNLLGNGDLGFANPLIGGYTSERLICTAEHDLYPWYPDVLVFPIYGRVDKCEEIVRNVRARTTSEIVLRTSHLCNSGTLDKNPDVDPRIVPIQPIAKRYDCTLIDVRKKWIACIKEKNLQPQALLSDMVDGPYTS